MENHIAIVVDRREEWAVELLKKDGIKVYVKNLPIGDFVLSEQWVIERKSAVDFHRSIMDGRLFEQAERMKERYDKICYIIEGSLSEGLVESRSAYGALAHLVIVYDAKILWTSRKEETIYLLRSLMKALHIGKIKHPIVKKPKNGKISEWQEFVVSSLPGVGSEISKSLLEKYETVAKVMNLSKKDLMKVEKIGEKKAKILYKVLHSNYKDEKTQRKLKDFEEE